MGLHEPSFHGVSFAQIDVPDPASIAQGLSGIEGTVDILVNNAGYIGAATSVLELNRRSADVALRST